MRYEIDPKLRITRGRRFFAALVLAMAMGSAHGQSLTVPATPAIITPPSGHSLFLIAPATGTQGYICLPTSAGEATASWTIKASRPEATLFQRVFGYDIQIATHFLSPDTNPNDAAPNPLPFGNATWQSSFDTSRVWAQVLHSNSIPAGSDPTCPNTGSIPCLLLQTVGSQQGPTGGTMLSKTSFIQRLNTRAGVAPADGCSTSADVGSQTLVPYTADYYFYRKNNSLSTWFRKWAPVSQIHRSLTRRSRNQTGILLRAMARRLRLRRPQRNRQAAQAN